MDEQNMPDPSGAPAMPPPPGGGGSRMQRFMAKLKTDRKTQVITAIVAILVIALIAVGIVAAVGGERISERSADDEELVDNNSYSRLNGTPVPEEFKDSWPIAVMIENLASVRPQSGLQDAGVVYETLAEGGITRFLVVFHGAPESERIGPIRSSRAYYLEWVSELDALYGHIGGSPEALGAISGLGIRDLDAMYSGSTYFERDRSIAAPHNLFSSGEKLAFALRDQELVDESATYDPWKFTDGASSGSRGPGTDVSIDFSSQQYAVTWTYDQVNNEYLRENGGSPHRDANTDEQIAAKNVIVQIVPPVEVTDDKGRLRVDLAGTGEVHILKDGNLVEGTWQKNDRESRTIFLDSDGNEIELTRGHTWVEVVPSDREVTFTDSVGAPSEDTSS